MDREKKNDVNDRDELPVEIKERLQDFDEALANVDTHLRELYSKSLLEIHEEVAEIDKARIDLVGAYTLNSLFWALLNVKGENPKEHVIRRELDRIKTYMQRVKEIEDKKKQPKLDEKAAKRFMRSALWQQAHKKVKAEEPKEQQAAAPPVITEEAEDKVVHKRKQKGYSRKSKHKKID